MKFDINILEHISSFLGLDPSLTYNALSIIKKCS